MTPHVDVTTSKLASSYAHVLGVADLELHGDALLGGSLARGVDEDRGEILPDDVSAAPGGEDRDRARTGRGVEHVARPASDRLAR